MYNFIFNVTYLFLVVGVFKSVHPVDNNVSIETHHISEVFLLQGSDLHLRDAQVPHPQGPHVLGGDGCTQPDYLPGRQLPPRKVCCVHVDNEQFLHPEGMNPKNLRLMLKIRPF